MKSTIFEGIAERLAEINREEAEARGYEVWGVDFGVEHKQITPQDIIDQAYRNLPLPTIDDAFEQMRKAMVARICPTYGHDIGLTGLCLNCGFKP